MLRLSALTVMVVCCLNEVTIARPAENHDDNQFIMELPVQTQIITLKPGKEVPPTQEPKTDNTREIIEKIKQINQNLKKPHRKHYYTYQKHLQPMDTKDIIMNSFDESQPTEPIKYSTAELLEKIKEINENLKKKTSYNSRPQIQFPNYFDEDGQYTVDRGEDIDDQLAQLDGSNNFVYNTRAKRSSMQKLVPYLLSNPTALAEETIEYTAPSIESLNENEPILNLPKYLIVPINTHQHKVHNRLLYPSSIENKPSLKQFPGLPTIPWPLAQYFPILIKDPFLALLHGGGLNNIVEYGQNADVCNKGVSKTKIFNPSEDIIDNTIEKAIPSERAGKAMKLKNRTSKNDESSTNLIPTLKKSKKSPISYKKPNKSGYQTPETTEPTDEYDKGNENEEDGNLRFSDFFGHKKPTIPSPGFFIGRLKVRKGGVAIAGPGGIATAGRGGTAIVGPGGLALTQPGGLAVAGPSARVVALSSDVDLNKLISLLRNQQAIKEVDSDEDESMPRRLDVIPGGKEVATGPIVYYHKPEDTETYMQPLGFPNEFVFTQGKLEYSRERPQRVTTSLSSSDLWSTKLSNHPPSMKTNIHEYIAEVATILNKNNYENKEKLDVKLIKFEKHGNETIIDISPVAHAIAENNGTAIANPVSTVILGEKVDTRLHFNPTAVAVVGPGGTERISSSRIRKERNEDVSTSYLPFYGGGKGQYLEVTKDKNGVVVKEAIVPEDQVKDINSIVKPNSNAIPTEQEIYKNIFENNLQNVQTSAQKILALHQLAQNKGKLTPTQVEHLITELNVLSETAGNLATLSESGKFNVSAILGSKDSEINENQKFEENVGEEGVGIESSENNDSQVVNATMAEAKPVGLAIAGEGGTASSKPVATAVVAAGGIAVARPVATAVAGVDPSLLGVGITYGKI